MCSEWRRDPEDPATTYHAFEAFQDAPAMSEALEDAHRRGIGWGYGYDPIYRGMVARPIPGHLDRDRHPLLWGHFIQGRMWADGVEHGEWIGRAADDVNVCLGMVCSEDAIERYLTSYPTPESW